MRGLIYREFAVQKKELLIGLLTTAVMVLLNIIFVCSARFGNLQFFSDAIELWKPIGTYCLGAGGFFTLCSQSAISADMRSGFLRYSMALPTPAWKFALARIICKIMLIAFSFIVYFGNAAFTLSMLGDTFDTYKRSLLLVVSTFLLLLSIIFEFLASFIKSDAAQTIVKAILFVGPIFAINTVIMNKIVDINDTADETIMNDPDMRMTYLLQELSQMLHQYDSVIDSISKVFPLLLIGIVALGFLGALCYFKRRNVLCQK